MFSFGDHIRFGNDLEILLIFNLVLTPLGNQITVTLAEVSAWPS